MVVAKLNKLALVPRRDLLNRDSVLIGADGKIGPKTSPARFLNDVGEFFM